MDAVTKDEGVCGKYEKRRSLDRLQRPPEWRPLQLYLVEEDKLILREEYLEHSELR